MITGVILTRNEESNIVDCVASLRPHVSELILIDMESTDRTVELAQPLVNRVLRHPKIPNFDAARNAAIPEARYDWLWFLDADERVQPATGRFIVQLLQTHGDNLSAITIPFKSYFCGKWIQHCGWWPGYTMARVLKRGRFHFNEQLHGGVQFTGAEYRVPPDPRLAIEHFSYRDIEHYVAKFNNYTSVESSQLAAHGQTLDWEQTFRSMVDDWWLYHEANNGMHEGQHGWILSWLAGQYRWFSHAKLLDHPQAGAEYKQIPTIDTIINVIQSEVTRQRAAVPHLPLGIVWRSPIFDSSGYADDSRILLRSLACGDRPLKVDEIRWSGNVVPLPDQDRALLKSLCAAKTPSCYASITSCIPSFPFCRPDQDAAINILRTTFETDRIPESWLPIIDSFDEVWVFSEHNRLSFRRGGVAPEKIRVLGSFIDTAVFKPTGPKRKLPDVLRDRFTFLSIFDWQQRKGWDALLRAYCTEFRGSSEAGLLLKFTQAHGHPLHLIQEQINAVLDEFGVTLKDRPDIVLVSDTLELHELAALYRSVDAFVLPSRGEGWGRPYMEAMACGIPTIGTRGSGNMDFMTDQNSFLIDSTLVTVPDSAAEEIPVYAGHQWLEPNRQHLQRQMRRVLEDVKARKRVAKQALSNMQSRFDLRFARDAVENNLAKAEQRFTRQNSAAVRDSAIRIQLEGELFANHSFANINQKLATHFANEEKLALTIRRVRHNPTHDRRTPDAEHILPFVDRPLPSSPQIIMRHAFPPNWESPTHGKWVHIQPWEFGVLPLSWIEPLRDRVDEVWAPSTYVKQVYERSGIPGDKIHVIPWGISADVFRPDVPSRLLPTNKSFRFLFVGGTIERKGFDTLLKAYLAEFERQDDVCLVIKDMGTRTFYRYGNYREPILQLMGDSAAPEILYFDADMTEGQLASLYASCNVLVAPYRGEGFGLPILEAMGCGIPAIVPCNGASDDFVTDDTGFRIPADVIDSYHEYRLSGIPTELKIDVLDLRRAMRIAFEHREETARRGSSASDHVHSHFTWRHSVQEMVDRLEVLTRGEQKARDATRPVRTATITLCVLLRNDEHWIADTLGSLRPFVDEIIAVDIGSTDRSIPIALEYSARVYREKWNGSYADTKNKAIVRATSDWVLFLNPGDHIDDPPARSVKLFLASLPPNVLGVNVGIESGAFRESETCIFRNQDGVVFEMRAAEHVRSSISRLQGALYDSDIIVRRMRPHTNEDLSEQRKLLHQEMAARPRDPTVLRTLGVAHFRAGNFFHAECYLHEYVSSSQLGDDEYSRAASLLITSHRAKGDPHRAIEVVQSALKRLPHSRELQSAHNELTALLGGGL